MASELHMRYGCNPHQTGARCFLDGADLPLQTLYNSPSYINLMDALNSWQLVRELKAATGQSAAASFKHVSPAGAAVDVPLSDDLRAALFIKPDAELSPLACAYARARGAEQRQRFGNRLIGTPRAFLAYRPQPFCNVGYGDINQTIVIFSELIIFAWNHTATNGWFCIKRFVIY